MFKPSENEEIVRTSEKENIIVTRSYNGNSCRYETNFYYLDTGKHWFTKMS